MGTVVLRSERVVTAEGVRPAVIVIEDERIAAVTDAPAPGAPVHDLGSLVVMPGLVDCHVHVNEPGRTEWEGFETATRAAAAGGVTALVDMPLNCIPVTTTRDALHRKLESVQGKLSVDVGFWGGVVPGNSPDLAALAEAGALGAKAFLCHSGIDDFPRATKEDLQIAMPVLRDAGIPLLAHAELELGLEALEDSPRRYATYLASRPRAWEDAAIALLIELCRQTRCPVHVVHLSSASALPMIAEAKAEGLPLSVETCPHYLCLRSEEIPDGHTEYKCAPPIREDDNRERLWQGLLDGVIDLVVSDHSPCTPALKKMERGDFMEAWGGIASLQLGLPSVWTEARARGAKLEDLARWMGAGPARLAGLRDRKGAIAAGADADLVVWDPDARFEVSREILRFRHKVSPYLGRALTGVVRETWLRGRRVFDGNEIASGNGRPLLHRGAA
ncbi:MAG: allantoinase AllB [Sandaracinaceae bacterium]|nr:allantoinase AllB [Sandaracinaceae bacterium]